MPKERPILFSGPMVKAILEGRKTQTRRIIKPQPPQGCAVGFSAFCSPGQVEFRRYSHGEVKSYQDFVNCPYGTKGDRLWVKETFRLSHKSPNTPKVIYRADDPGVIGAPWKPSIFMPRWASRITLEIVCVRVERLQDISEADAKAEGVSAVIGKTIHGWTPHVLEYSLLWDSINSKTYPWKSKPWVWVISFKILLANPPA